MLYTIYYTLAHLKWLSLIRVMSNFEFLDPGRWSTFKRMHFLLLQKLTWVPLKYRFRYVSSYIFGLSLAPFPFSLSGGFRWFPLVILGYRWLSLVTSWSFYLAATAENFCNWIKSSSDMNLNDQWGHTSCYGKFVSFQF